MTSRADINDAGGPGKLELDLEAPIAPWMVRAKASPPRASANEQRRTRLLDYLAVQSERQVIVCEAPAGFGKTTVLSQWREKLIEKGRVVAWLAADETDESDVLLPYLALSFQLAGLDMAQTDLLYPTYHGDRISLWVGRLLHQIEASNRRCTLVLDDAERIPADAAAAVINPILRSCPANLQICLAFRRNPGIALSQLAMRDQLTVLHPSDLKFSADEIRAWLAGKLDHRAIDMLIDKSNGWPVALQLHRGAAGWSSEMMSEMQSRNAESYIQEQVLAQLTAEQTRFLQDTSLLDSIPMSCADAIREAGNSEIIAEQIHARLEGLFAPLENADGVYRLHPLIRDHLCAQLPHHDAANYLQLNLRAAGWMVEHAHPLSAIAFAVTGGDTHFAATLLEKMGGAQLFLREGLSRLRAALALLDGQDLTHFPRVQIARAAVLAKDGNMHGAKAAMDSARVESDNFRKDREGGSVRALRIDGHLVELLLSEYGCEPNAQMMSDPGLQEVQELTRDDPPLSALILTWRCLTSGQMGFLEKAFHFGQLAIDEFRRGNSTYGELFIYLHFGQAEMARARCRAALLEYAKARRLARTDFPGDMGVRRICNIALGEVHWDSGDLIAAQKHLRNVAKQVRHPEAWFDLMMAAYRCSAEYLAEQSGVQAATLYLEEAREHTAKQGLNRLTDYIDALQFLLFSRTGLSAEAQAHAQRFGSRFALCDIPESRRTWREMEISVQAVSHLSLQRKTNSDAGAYVANVAALAQSRGLVRLALQCHLYGAILSLRSDSAAAARTELISALSMAAEEHYIRPFLLERQQLKSLLDEIAVDPERSPPAVVRLARELIDWVGVQSADTSGEVFSIREAEIISFLSKGQSDKLIARSVGLSAHGVRYHLKNIYAKLGVQNRTQAISRAQELGLLA